MRRYVRPTDRILDMDTCGGERLLELGHDPALTSATEGYPPNVQLCREKLLPLGIDFRQSDDPAHLPFADGTFDAVLNRHGSYDFRELHRILKPGGIFLTQQVGDDNDREFVELVLPGVPNAFPGQNLAVQRKCCEDAGFTILYAAEAYRHMDFYTMEAFIWFAGVIPWEFPGFSVEVCYDRLSVAEEILHRDGRIRGTVHRYCIAARSI
ncbi:MAG: methyltransferase domain-containing protein [Clostridia bacterium]|nr:methyltransferase domain-containing protein [Clostridia bacterium]